MPAPLPRLRSIRPFWEPVEKRYFVYERPEHIDAVCPRCKGRFTFKPKCVPAYDEDPIHGGIRAMKGEVCGIIAGCGACSWCGHVSQSLSWPDSAYLKVKVPGGILWAWNMSHIPAIRARVNGDEATLRTLLYGDWRLARIIGRIPKFATLKKNRRRILAALDRMESSA
jgi:hypothetical protein